MSWTLDKERPICPQLCEQLCVAIAVGRYKPEDRLPSVRELALEAGVNPNTVQRSYELLEQQGILYTVRGSGRFVSQEILVAKQTVEDLKKQKTEEYFSGMKALGLDTESVKNYIKEWDYE